MLARVGASLASRGLARPPAALLGARLCSGSGEGKPPRAAWDPAAQVHGRTAAMEDDVKAMREAAATPKGGRTGREQERGREQPRSAGSSWRGRRMDFGAGFGEDAGPGAGARKSDMLQFQLYVRQRLREMNARLPPRLGTRENAELSFLEEQVIQDHMPRGRRQLRDPLLNVPLREITHTNLPLLNRFVSEVGAILPKKLTGVKAKKQKKLTKAIKRAVVLALMPKTWKLPQYRHASYADQYSKPERPLLNQRPEGDEFRDPPDIRYPNQWEGTRFGAFDVNLSSRARAGGGLGSRSTGGSLTAPKRPDPSGSTPGR